MNLIIRTMGLDDFRSVQAKNLSGGNKRKLSCAMTLMLSPHAEFLDEPTTGVDPVSRRKLFRLIKHLNKSAVVLTTHRMDEAESLCDQIAIMVNGKIAVYGTPGYLMHSYGSGYIVEVESAKGNAQHVKREVARVFVLQNCELQDELEKPEEPDFVNLRFRVAEIGSESG